MEVVQVHAWRLESLQGSVAVVDDLVIRQRPWHKSRCLGGNGKWTGRESFGTNLAEEFFAFSALVQSRGV